MKLILASEGFYTNEIVKKCEELVGKPKDLISIAIINEAYAVQEDTLRWVLNNLDAVRDNFGGSLELVNLLALDIGQVKDRIEKHDAIFVVGGQTDYLMSVFNKTGFTKLLPKLLKTKVYIGSSAGSMVMGHRLIPKAYEKMYGQRDEYGITRYLELVDLSIVPHLDSAKRQERRDLLKDAANDHTTSVIYGLRDDSAVVIDGSKITTIGSEPYIFNRQ
jgi:dipeptidase E